MYSSVHVHTNFCDGSASPEQMAQAAYEKGIKVLGFSSHTYDPVYDYGVKPERLYLYRDEIMKVKSLYEGKLEILCGIEYDPISPKETPLDCWDYIIGSCHNLKAPNGSYYSVDHNAECISIALCEGFSGDVKALVEAFYQRVVDFFGEFTPDIVGHFDLVKKTNIKNPFFDENAGWYREITLCALDSVMKSVSMFEVNTGAISRGWRSDVYPDDFLLKRIKEKGGRVIITSDSHAPETLDFYYKEACDFVRAAGFEKIAQLTPNGFIMRDF